MVSTNCPIIGEQVAVNFVVTVKSNGVVFLEKQMPRKLFTNPRPCVDTLFTCNMLQRPSGCKTKLMPHITCRVQTKCNTIRGCWYWLHTFSTQGVFQISVIQDKLQPGKKSVNDSLETCNVNLLICTYLFVHITYYRESKVIGGCIEQNIMPSPILTPSVRRSKT